MRNRVSARFARWQARNALRLRLTYQHFGSYRATRERDELCNLLGRKASVALERAVYCGLSQAQILGQLALSGAVGVHPRLQGFGTLLTKLGSVQVAGSVRHFVNFSFSMEGRKSIFGARKEERV